MKRGLGRGLDKLLGAPAGAQSEAMAGVRMMKTGLLQAGAGQPRRQFDPESLQTLADSIRRHGVMQPIMVRPIENGFEIVAGERRFRAAQMAGLETVPVIARELSDQEAMVLALVENIQRAELNPAEQSRGISRLIKEFGMTHEQTAAHVGMSRAAVTNLLRLLSLSPPVLNMLEQGRLGAAHARALLSLPPALQQAAAREIVAKRLSARAAEVLAKKLAINKPRKTSIPDADTRRLQSELSTALSSRVQIRHGRRGGTLTVHYTSLEVLDKVIKKLRS